MSQTDSLEDHLIVPELDIQRLQSVAQQLGISFEVLNTALRQLEKSGPASAVVCLQLLQALSLETMSWKAGPQAQLLKLIFASNQGAESPETQSLRYAVTQLYPELFGLESSIDS